MSPDDGTVHTFTGRNFTRLFFFFSFPSSTSVVQLKNTGPLTNDDFLEKKNVKTTECG